MDENQTGREKYEYCSLASDAMDKIQKRTGYIRTITSILIVALTLFLFKVNGVKQFSTIDLARKIPNNFTDDGRDYYTNRVGVIARTCTLFSLWMLVFVIANFLNRICLLVEELCHRKTRYNGSYKKLLIAVFYGSWNKMYGFGSLGVIMIVCVFGYHPVILDVYSSNKHMLTMALMCLLFWFTHKRWSDTEFEHSASCAPCVGIAMAYGAYYNYFQHVLQGLKERIENSERQFAITIPIKKLILLFPSSGSIPSILSDGTDNLKCLKDLPDVEKDKGGTLDRKMTNPIYRVSPPNISPFYCVLEGVNCLSTLKQMNLPEEVFRQQAHLLYITLKQILEKSPYKNSYVLLCYDDENDSESLIDHLCITYGELLRQR